MEVAYRTRITVAAEFRAQHRWQACPHEDVAFLRDWHRHLFKVTLSVAVGHGDRQVEFFQLQALLREHVAVWEGQQVDMSCEMFAEDLMRVFVNLGYAVQEVSVSEDGENSATVELRGCLWQSIVIA